MKSIEETLEFLYSLQGNDREYRFGAVKEAMGLLGNPHRKMKCVLVAGTNGKGSVCHCISSILRKAGYRAGMFTSPHLMRFNERIVAGNEEIPDDAIIRLASEVEKKIGDLKEKIGFFGFVFCMSVLYFIEKEVDIGVIEVGLGGRLDPTNVLDPMISIVTNTELDHTAILGDTIEKISYEKTGIIKGNLALSGVHQKERWSDVESRAKKAYFIGRDLLVRESSGTLGSMSIDMKGLKGDYKINTNLVGTYQPANILLAVGACELLEEFGYRISRDQVMKGLEKVPLRGRFEVIKKDGVTIILDGGHNEAGMLGLARSISSLLKDRYILLAALSTGRDPAIMKDVADSASGLIITEASYKAQPAETIAEVLGKGAVRKDVRAALGLAMERADKYIVVAGSLYLVGDLLREL